MLGEGFIVRRHHPVLVSTNPLLIKITDYHRDDELQLICQFAAPATGLKSM